MDICDLAPLYRLPPPVVTWYIATAAQAEDNATHLEIAWKNGLRELADKAVDAATVDALAAVQQTEDVDSGTRVLVAAGGEIHLDRQLPLPALDSELWVAPLPRLLPLIGWLGAHRPHVVVLTDHEGADVIAYPSTGGMPVAEVSEQTGEWPVHKTGTGGWAAKRFEATVEEGWERSAQRVAALVDDVARRIDPAVVVGSGDEHAIGLLRERLPVALQDSFVAVPGGGRHADGGNAELGRRVAEAVAASAAQDEVETLERFAEARGRNEGAADGIRSSVRALQMAQVDALIVARGMHASERELSYGPAATQLALDDGELSAMAVERPSRTFLVDVAVRAALGTDADVLVVSDDTASAPRDGIGALLRFDVAATRSSAG
ncbi:MAG TPA: Vms1/Ankzf1 family peptidyl-tRNA hydrolase [Mycobacteriales bacterium]|nr:Vms1/Ankzf1 family peptidyl-tRNA hydrolase [Mycobacteriales bacterium]